MASSSTPCIHSVHLPIDDMILDDKNVWLSIPIDGDKFNRIGFSVYQDSNGILRIQKEIIQKLHDMFVPRNHKLIKAYNNITTEYLTISEIETMILRYVIKSSAGFDAIQRFISTSLDCHVLREMIKNSKHITDEFRLKQLLSQDSLLNGNLKELIELKKRYPKLNLSIFMHSKWTNMIDFINIFLQ